MRILFLNNFYYLRGGSERVLFGEMRLLREAGHEVAIYARGHEKNEPAEYAGFFPPPLDTERLGLSIKSIATVRELIYSESSRQGLREVVKRFRPDIVHAHNIYGRLSLSVLDELKAAGVPVVMTLHDLKLLCPSYLMLNKGKVCELCKGGRYANAFLTRCHKGSYPASFVYALESWLNKTSDKYGSVQKFVVPSRFLRDKCVEHGWDSSRFAYLPNCIDKEGATASDGVGDYLLYMGRLSAEKGIGTLLRAYRQSGCTMPLMIVGDGPLRKELEGASAGCQGRVTFTGYLTGVDLATALRGASCVLLPSECYENAPLSILEAFAAGKPVIGSRIGGIPELVDDEINGFLFEPGNADALTAKIQAFLNLSATAVAAMGEAARLKVEREFSPRAHMESLHAIYHAVLRS
ncbi:glycosyltransferase family 4 protein [Geobacter pelophilus]|uniref:Glycosyltransferase family 4 protein n=1 Tax=Geoanaerobacter pelophilus TaxID=60036 RepID=A0AAW4L9D0_9BACT|nr:glycosyltransferase family 4 protein [Geoanaerobacter pelophilus]MBT0666185.1 glycosyltransferase family 4 protein [Geoanaerobacter pelophilus]